MTMSSCHHKVPQSRELQPWVLTPWGPEGSPRHGSVVGWFLWRPWLVEGVFSLGLEIAPWHASPDLSQVGMDEAYLLPCCTAASSWRSPTPHVTF